MTPPDAGADKAYAEQEWNESGLFLVSNGPYCWTADDIALSVSAKLTHGDAGQGVRYSSVALGFSRRERTAIDICADIHRKDIVREGLLEVYLLRDCIAGGL